MKGAFSLEIKRSAYLRKHIEKRSTVNHYQQHKIVYLCISNVAHDLLNMSI